MCGRVVATIPQVCTLAERRRITLPTVVAEIAILSGQWTATQRDTDFTLRARRVPDLANIDEFDRA